jgi:hypothetical protein
MSPISDSTSGSLVEWRDCHSPGVVSLERTRFFPRQLVAPNDLTQDQIYFREKLRRHNRLLHGWGIVCGARVDISEGCTVIIRPGYVLGPYGDEMVIDPELTIDVCKPDSVGALDCFDRDPWCRDVTRLADGSTVYLAVRYVEHETRPVRVPGCGCGCDEAECEYSRTRDDYEVKVLTELPRDYEAAAMSAWENTHSCAGGRDRPCPRCPEGPWVILADLVLSGGSIVEPVGEAHRRYVAAFGNYAFTCPPD